MLLIISDVHANLIALKKIFDMINWDEIDMVVHAGDIVGYNPFPNEVIQEFKLRGVKSILGNHDRAVIYDDYTNFNPYAESAARWTRKKLTEESMRYLTSLPTRMEFEYDGKRFLMVHGAPFDDDYYLYKWEATEDLLGDYDVLICGHTHVPFINKFKKGVIINPGSVGQPRDGNPRASYALYNGEKFIIKRVKYDIDSVVRRIAEENLPIILGERLYFGR